MAACQIAKVLGWIGLGIVVFLVVIIGLTYFAEWRGRCKAIQAAHRTMRTSKQWEPMAEAMYDDTYPEGD